MGCARYVALALLVALAAPVPAFGEQGTLGEPASLGDAFASAAEEAEAVDVEPPEPDSWF